MIYDSLKHIAAYQGIHPGVYKGLELLANTDFSKLEDGRYEIDGNRLFFSLQSYNSKPKNETPEAHKTYIDIQFLVSGTEQIKVAPLEDMVEEVEARPDGDIWFYRGPTDTITLTGDRFAVFWPGDAHPPGIAVEAPAPCRKCLVKVQVDWS